MWIWGCGATACTRNIWGLNIERQNFRQTKKELNQWEKDRTKGAKNMIFCWESAKWTLAKEREFNFHDWGGQQGEQQEREIGKVFFTNTSFCKRRGKVWHVLSFRIRVEPDSSLWWLSRRCWSWKKKRKCMKAGSVISRSSLPTLRSPVS